ncbi:protein NnrT [Phaeovulum sp. W22_SRMD_FR3]|uniref:protein NnrT n=1 Tax=Phaeovulum sp. W22_SRMD_FR3 TaxID=3240274 RepID=UPI003F98CDC2
MRYMIFLMTLLHAGSAAAAEFQRPIPQAQSATVETSFALAALALAIALLGVHWLVRRR